MKDRFAIQWQNGAKVNQPSITLIGQRTAITTQYTGRDFLNFQIVFQPTALFRLTGIPNYELTDKCIDAEFVFAENSKPVFELLQYAKSYEEMLEADLAAAKIPGAAFAWDTMVDQFKKNPIFTFLAQADACTRCGIAMLMFINIQIKK